jgi:hypothetical protein
VGACACVSAPLECEHTQRRARALCTERRCNKARYGDTDLAGGRCADAPISGRGELVHVVRAPKYKQQFHGLNWTSELYNNACAVTPRAGKIGPLFELRRSLPGCTFFCCSHVVFLRNNIIRTRLHARRGPRQKQYPTPNTVFSPRASVLTARRDAGHRASSERDGRRQPRRCKSPEKSSHGNGRHAVCVRYNGLSLTIEGDLTHTRVHANTQHVYTRSRTCMRAHTHTCAHAHRRTRTPTCTCVYTRACVNTRARTALQEPPF